MKTLNKFIMKMVTVALLAVMAGCSASSNSSDSTTDSGTSSGSSAVKGNVTLSGAVTVSNADQLQVADSVSGASARVMRLQGLSLQARHKGALKLLESTGGKVISSADDEVPMEGGMIYVSYLDSTGDVVSTDISAEISPTGSYSIPNLKDGITYILTAEKVGFDADGNINKIKTEAISTVKTGATTAAANLQPGTDVIMRSVISAIQETVQSLYSTTDIDTKTKDLINTFIFNIIEKTTESVSAAIKSGEITLSTSVEIVKPQSELADLSEAQKDAEKEKIVTSTKKVQVNTELSDTDKKVKSQLETDSSIQDIVQETQVKAQAAKDVSKMTFDEAKALIRSVFGASEGGTASDSSGSDHTSKDKDDAGDVPDFFITQFANAYLAKKNITLTTYATSWKQASGDKEERSDEELKTAFAQALTDKLTLLYAYYDTGVTTNLSEIPNLAGAKISFPKDKRITLPATAATELNVAQTISEFFFTGLFDKTGDEGDNKFDPFIFLKNLGVTSFEASKVYIVEAGLRPVRFYAPDDFNDQQGSQWNQIDALTGDISLFAESGITPDTIKKVVLRYTKINGTQGVAEFQKEENNNGGQGGDNQEQANSNSMVVMSRISASKVSAYNIKVAEDSGNQGNSSDGRLDLRYRLDPWMAMNNKEKSKIVSDFKTGDATIVVLGAGDVELAKITVKIYKISMNAPEWVFPIGPDMVKIKKQGWDSTFEPQLIALADGQTSLSKMRFEWKASTPAEPLPEGLRIAYSVFVGFQVHKKDWNSPMGDTLGLIPSGTLGRKGAVLTADNEDDQKNGYWDWVDQNGNKWKHIWDSWEQRSFIYGNSITLPEKVVLAATTASSLKNFEGSYEISVRPIVVDKRGFVVWEGEESRSNFKVGQDINWATVIKGTIVFPNAFDTLMPHVKNITGTWKVGLFYNNKTIVKNGKTKIRPVFYDQDNDQPRGVIRTQAGVPLVASIGTAAEIKNAPSRTYTLPSFSKTDEILKMNEDMMIKVWLDVTTKPSNDFRWTDITPSLNAIDFVDNEWGSNAIEENTDLEFGQIRRGQEGIVRWKQDGSQFISDGGEVEINGRVFNWFGDKASFVEVPKEKVPTNNVKKESDASKFENNNQNNTDQGGDQSNNEGQQGDDKKPTFVNGVFKVDEYNLEITLGEDYVFNESLKTEDSLTYERASNLGLEQFIIHQPNSGATPLADVANTIKADALNDGATVEVTDVTIDGSIAGKKIHVSKVENFVTQHMYIYVFYNQPSGQTENLLFEIKYVGDSESNADSIANSIVFETTNNTQ